MNVFNKRSFTRWMLKGLVLVALLGAASCNETNPTNTQDPLNEPISLQDTLSWYLTSRDIEGIRIDNLPDLKDTLATYGIQLNAFAGLEYRFDPDYKTYFENGTGYLKDIAYGDTVLYSHMGVSDDSLLVEVQASKEWLENLIAREVRTFAYPAHDHDRRTMTAVESSGHIAGRSGVPSGAEPWSAYLFGHYSNPEWQTSWQAASLYEMPLTILCSNIQSLEISEIESWVYQEENMPSWRENGTWIQLYTHTCPDDSMITGTPTLDAEHLNELLNVLEEDGGVWIGSMGEIAEYFRSYHHPSSEEGFIWDFNENSGVPIDQERRYDTENPWNGHKCAFTFSTDDGWKSNLTEFAPVFEQHGKMYTVFLNPNKVMNPWIAYMDESEVLQLSQSVAVDIGNHSFNHKTLIHDAFATYSGSGQIEIRATEIDGVSVKMLNLILER